MTLMLAMMASHVHEDVGCFLSARCSAVAGDQVTDCDEVSTT
jgi:hypothetical protein